MAQSSMVAKDQSEFTEAISDLAHTVLHNLIYLTGAACLLLQILVGTLGSESLAKNVMLILPALLVCSAIALHLSASRLRTAQIIWQIGLLTTITLAVVRFRDPNLSLLFAIVPFLTIFMHELILGILTWVGITVIMLVLSLSPSLSIIEPNYIVPVSAAAMFTGTIGWTASRTLYMITEWSFLAFAQAQRSMDDAREKRGHLAQVLKDLDQAYYRLERTNAALVAAWRAAAVAEQEKAGFATDLSHEMRTPLNLVIGFSEMMLTAPHKYGNVELPRPYHSDLYTIYQNAKHLDALVTDVLDLSRIGSGRLVLTREETSVAELVQEAVAMVKDYTAVKGLDLQVQVDHNVPSLWADRLRVRQVLLNLLVNAARFTEAGSIRVEVSRRDSDVLFRVCDTGRGIPERELASVFEEFKQVGASGTSGWDGGTGLGLPISKKLVGLHGGEMGIESVYQQGTTVWFTLPCLHGRSAEEGLQPSTLVRPAPYRLEATRRLLVVVSNDQQAAGYLQRQLGQYKVIVASSMNEGMTLAAEHKALGLVSEEPLDGQVLERGTVCIQCPLPSPSQTARRLGARALLIKPVSDGQLWSAIEQLGSVVRRVLVVDDDPDMVRLIQQMLTPRIHPDDCVGAHDGEQALNMVHSLKPDLVLLDLAMPHRDGQWVLGQLAQDSAYANMPVIVISAMDDMEVETMHEQPVQISRSGGLRPDQVTRVVEASLNALVPGWY